MCTKVHYHLNVVVPKNDGGCVVPATDLRWLSMKLPPPSDAAIHEDEELTTSNSVSSLLLLFGVIQFMASSHGKFLEMIWYL